MKLWLILSCLLFWGACQSSPIYYVPKFENFEINKITEHGIQNVEVIPSSNGKDWPDVDYDEIEPIKIKSENIKIAVIGDTGCRLKENKDKKAYQNCNDAKEWPYPEIVKSLIKEKFDFAIHTGDYHYREQCSDAKICPAYTKSIGYTWATWWDDFYGPSQDLFKKTPLLLIRGNHEDCERAHSGWAPLSVFKKQFDDKCDAIEPYQWIEIGDLVFINFDDSGFEERKESKPEVLKKYELQFKEIAQKIRRLKSNKEIWFLAHKPVFGYVPDKEKKLEPNSIKHYLKGALERSGLLKEIDYFLAGHIHNQQLVIKKDQLQQIIVGHSGTALDPFGKKIINENFISTTASDVSFGYALFERTAFKKWNLVFKNKTGETELECKLKNRKIRCSAG